MKAQLYLLGVMYVVSMALNALMNRLIILSFFGFTYALSVLANFSVAKSSAEM
jgi:hypothetical protein